MNIDCTERPGDTIRRLAQENEMLEIQLWQAKGALGYPVPGHIPEGSFKCGLCAAKEKDYQRSKTEQQTLWKAFQVLAESR